MFTQERVKKTGLSLLLLFYSFSFIGKAAMNMSIFFLMIVSLIYIFLYQRDILRKNSFLVIMLTPLLIGFFLGFFSEFGFKGPFYFINRFKFILLLIPLTLFADSRKKFFILYSAICLSGATAIIYGLITPGGHSYASFTGFHQIGRTADMMMLLSLSLSVFIFAELPKKNFRREAFVKLLLITIFAFTCWAVLFSSIRGSWLGFLFGLMTYIIFFKRKALIFIIILMLFTLAGNFDRYKNEFLSIFDLKSNVSNNTRIHLLKTGLDFSFENFWFGTGAKNSKELFIEFFESQDKDYQQKYNRAMDYPKDFHNSYLQIYIETGIIFFIMFLFSHFYLLYKLLKYCFKVKNRENIDLIIVFLITSSAFFISQFFHGEFHSYGSSLFYFFMYGGCMISNEYFNETSFIKKIRK